VNANSIGFWIKRQFREIPLTSWLVAINLVVWLLDFFQISQPANLLAGEVGVSTAWRWLTYPLHSPLSFLWLLLSLYIFTWIGGSLERTWGTERFLRVFVVVTLLSACTAWLGAAYLVQSAQPKFFLAGLYIPEATLFVIWAALFPEMEVLMFFVLPLKAKYLALASIVMTYFGTGPVIGLFAISLPIAGWFWAKRWGDSSGPRRSSSKSISQRIQEKKREHKKSRFTLLEGKSLKESQPTTPPTQIPDLRELNRDMAAKEKSANEAELDRILDKIRFEGMASLSEAEKQTLDKQSKRLKEES
jgi:membrane associated rhomboid family serine protease